MDRLDVGNAPLEITKIETEEQARNWVAYLVGDMLKWRDACNVIVPGNREATVKFQNRALWTFLNKQGQVVGALKALRMTNKISEVAFKEMNQAALDSLVPSVVGSM